jgi:hypothetical protein
MFVYKTTYLPSGKARACLARKTGSSPVWVASFARIGQTRVVRFNSASLTEIW